MAGDVSRLPKDPGPAGWARLLPRLEPATPIERDTTADWLVIGAGFAGLAAARRLSQRCPGDRIVVLDACQIGEGPAGRNSGFMIDLPHDLTSKTYAGKLEADRAQTEDNRLAIDFAADMVREFGLPDEAFARSGKINAAASAKGDEHNRAFAAHLDAMGEDHKMLDARNMADITGTQYYRSGVFTPGAVTIQPAMFVREIARGLTSNRLTIHENSPVTSLERKTDWVARTPGGDVTAPRVILAVNGHLESFGRMAGRLMHVFTYASMTRALDEDECAAIGGQRRWGLTPADPLGSTVRRISGTGGDRIVIRNRFTFDPSMEVSERRVAEIGQQHDRHFAARFPKLAGIGMEYRWGGRLCLSRNNVQVIGALDAGLWSACCQNGLGIAKGTLAGMLAVDDATGHGSAALDRARSAPRPARLPPLPIAKIGAGMRLGFGHWRAGREL